MKRAEHLYELSHEDWFALVAEFAAIRGHASPGLQRLLREELAPIVQEVNRSRWQKAYQSGLP